MLEALKIGAGVATPLGLIGLVATLVFFARARQLKYKESILEKLSPEARSNFLDEGLIKYKINAENATRNEKFQLIKLEMEKRYRLDALYALASAVVFVICFSLAVFAFIAIQHRNQLELKDTSERSDVPEQKDTVLRKTEVFNVLFLAANPVDAGGLLKLDEEMDKVEEALRRKGESHRFHLKKRKAAKPEDLRRAFLDERPTIIHFAGHGDLEGLVFENDSGKKTVVSPESLLKLFELSNDELQCVVLNACYSTKQAMAICKCVKYIIGTPGKIDDDAAVCFSVGFYDALAAGKGYTNAFQYGCNSIRLNGFPMPGLHECYDNCNRHTYKEPALSPDDNSRVEPGVAAPVSGPPEGSRAKPR